MKYRTRRLFSFIIPLLLFLSAVVFVASIPLVQPGEQPQGWSLQLAISGVLSIVSLLALFILALLNIFHVVKNQECTKVRKTYWICGFLLLSLIAIPLYAIKHFPNRKE